MIDHHDDHATPPAALRPPPPGTYPTHRGRDHRHEPRRTRLDSPCVAPPGTERRRHLGRDKPEDIRTSARSPGTPATREEARGTPSARPRCASNLGWGWLTNPMACPRPASAPFDTVLPVAVPNEAPLR